MAKKKAETAEPEPSGVKVELRDVDENTVIHTFYTEPYDRHRVYRWDGLSYTASYQQADGSWVYRQETH